MALMWSASDRDVATENEGSGQGNTSQRSIDLLGYQNWRGRRGKTVFGLTKSPLISGTRACAIDEAKGKGRRWRFSKVSEVLWG